MKRSACKRFVLTLIGVVAFGLFVVWLAFWIPGLPGPLHGAYLARGSLYNIYGGLRCFNNTHGHLPPATSTDAESGELATWRIECYRSFVSGGSITPLKTAANKPIDYNYHKAWNDPENLQLQGQAAYLFRYMQFDVALERNRGQYGIIYTTYYKAITGPDTAFDTSTPLNLKELPNDVVLVVRVEKSDTHWMEPGDLNIEQLTPSERTKQLLLGKDGYVVLFADGEGWVLSDKTPLSDLCKFFTLAGAKQFDREQVLGPYRVLP